MVTWLLMSLRYYFSDYFSCFIFLVLFFLYYFLVLFFLFYFSCFFQVTMESPIVDLTSTTHAISRRYFFSVFFLIELTMCYRIEGSNALLTITNYNAALGQDFVLYIGISNATNLRCLIAPLLLLPLLASILPSCILVYHYHCQYFPLRLICFLPFNVVVADCW